MTKNKLVKLTYDYGKQKNILYLIQNNYKFMREQEKNKKRII